MTDIVKREGEPSGDFRSDNNFLLGFSKKRMVHCTIAMMQSV